MAFRGMTNPNTEGHHEPYWDLIKRIITESDVVMEVLDARLIELSRNAEVERLIEEVGRPLIFVINKSDLTTKNAIEPQIQELEKKGSVVFVSAKSPKTVKVLLYTIKKVFQKHGKRLIPTRGRNDPKSRFREAKANIVAGILGYPNVGKSAIINAICHRKKSPVSKKAGTTHGVHWIKASNEIKLLDSPGVIPLVTDDDTRYGLICARDTERLKNPELVAHAIINMFMKSNKKKFENFYGVVIDTENPYDVIEALARKRGNLLKGGIIDENRTVHLIVRDWQHGNLRL
jgi:ribosome biogenesis GTPase A